MARSEYCVLSILIFALSFFLSTIAAPFPSKLHATTPSEFAAPLFTESRWIVNKAGNRVKLACVNWPSHVPPVLAEGLHTQPVDSIIYKVKLMGFNCVRFTWPADLATNGSLASLTVDQSFQRFGLNAAIAGIKANNPLIVDLTLIDAFKAMLSSFERNKMMVILDNHVSVPAWCCNINDGNGFFGDVFFDPNLWKAALQKMATIATKYRCVVGMSLRNELRGPKSNVDVWYKYMQEGAETVHAANPDVLVILSGLKFDVDLAFVRTRPIELPFERKLVFEMHWYSFAHFDMWSNQNPNDVCGLVGPWMMSSAGYLSDQGYPLFVSEFGASGKDTGIVADNRYLNCFLTYAVDNDWDFAVWTLQGSYYFRQEKVDMDEWYGLLDHNWDGVRNASLLKRYSAIQLPYRDPSRNKHDSVAHKIVFHPNTGLCIQKGLLNPMRLGPCQLAQPWTYTTQNALKLKNADFFLQAVEPNQPAVLLYNSENKIGPSWEKISASKLHLSSKGNNGTELCLDTDEEGVIVTNYCKCLTKDNSCEPFSQWFKVFDSTRI